MIKKLCSVILSLALTLGAFGSMSALAYDDVTTSGQKSAVELVSGLEIMSADSKDEFGSRTVVKRGEFALYVARLMNYSIVPSTTSRGRFADVDATTEEGAAIEILAGIGAIASDAEQFNPLSAIEYNAAIKMILSCAGYDGAAESAGGYPKGYIKLAADNELNKNLTRLSGTGLTKTEVAVLLYNALILKPMEYENRDYKKSSETLLEKIYDVYEKTGIVTGYGKTSLMNKQVGNDQVQIDGETYECKVPRIKDYIGYNVKFYYSDVKGDGLTVVSFTEKAAQNTVRTVDAEDIDTATSTNVKYYPNGSTSSTRNQKISADATMIYNGRFRSNYGDYGNVITGVQEGDITFIANDGSDTANVIIINAYEHLLIERTDKKNFRLFMQNSSRGIKDESDPTYLPDSITVDPDELENVSICIGEDEVSFENIQAGDAVTMKRSLDGQNVELYISRNVVTGTIGTISDDEMNISGTKYDISPYIDKEYKSGTAGTFAITTNGKILGIVNVEGGYKSYAYVLKSYIDDNEEKATLKLYSTTGKVAKYDCTSNVHINGNRRNYREVVQQITEGDLITYSLNSEGQISTIHRPYDASSRYISVDDEGGLDLYVNDTEFVKDWSKSSVRYVDGIMGMTFITEDTTIFAMPRFDDGDESEYRLLSVSDLENRIYSDVTAYDIDRQGRAGCIVIVEDVATSVSMANPLVFISKVSEAITDDNEDITRITGFEKGVEITLDFDDDSKSVTYEDGWMNYSGNEDFDTGYKSLKPGDAIQYLIGNDGKVSAYRLVYNNKKAAFDKRGGYLENNVANYYEKWSKTGAVTKQDFSDNLYICYGDVQMRYMDYMLGLGLNEEERLKYASSSSPVSIMDYYRAMNLVENAYIYVYHIGGSSRKGATTVEVGDIEDIQKGDCCFFRSKKMGELNEIMVYQQ